MRSDRAGFDPIPLERRGITPAKGASTMRLIRSFLMNEPAHFETEIETCDAGVCESRRPN
jgi:hypothetical protein